MLTVLADERGVAAAVWRCGGIRWCGNVSVSTVVSDCGLHRVPTSECETHLWHLK